MGIFGPLVFFSVGGAVLLLFLTRKDEGPHAVELRRILLVALGLRICVAMMFALIPQTRVFHEDAEGYEWWAARIARGWHGEFGTVDYMAGRETNYGYPYFIAFFNYFLGDDTSVGSLANSVVGTVTILFVYRLACHMFHPRVAISAARLVAFFPSMVLWSAMALKDPLVTLLGVLILFAAIRLKEHFSVRNAAMVLFFLVCIQPLRFYIIYFIGLAILLSLLIERGFGAIRGLYLQIFLVGVVLALVTGLGLVGRLQAGTEMLSLERINDFRRGMAHTANSGFAHDVDISTPGGALAFLPIGMSVLLFGPFPWQMLSFRAAMTAPEMLVWWSLVPALYFGIRYAIKTRLPQTSPILLFAAMLTVAYSLIHGNVGSAFRQRAQIFVFLFIFAALGRYVRKCKRAGIDPNVLLAPADRGA